MSPTNEEIAKTYLNYCRLAWAEGDFFELVYDHPAGAWEVMIHIAENAGSPDVEELIAAGPFKIFIIKHGEEYIAEICDQARESAAFLRILRGVRGIESLPPAVRNRLKKIL